MLSTTRIEREKGGRGGGERQKDTEKREKGDG